ncbi:MAG: MATE family efflux transporter [Minwuia sp.]|nr:MATE family efflux transporter [Minwuia sp.]
MSQAQQPLVAAPLTLGHHIWQTLKLAGPVVVARSGVLIMMAVDTAMTGSAGGDELAYFGLGLSPTIALTLLGLGFLLGVTVLTSQADGAGEPARAGHIWHVGMGHAVVVGILFAGICQFGITILGAFGQAPDLAEGAGRVMHMLGWGLPAVLIFVACSFFLEGVSRPVAGMIIMLGANVLNLGLNWVFIQGTTVGDTVIVAAMGAEGAALATTIARWVTAFVAIGYIWFMSSRDVYCVRGGGPVVPDVGKRIRAIGYPMGLGMFIETAAFMAMTQMAGYLGKAEVAGYQIAHNLVALVFMSAIGIGAATGVRVGNAVGRNDVTGVRLAGLTGIGLVVMAMIMLGGCFILIPEFLTGLYTPDRAVAATAIAALAVASSMMIFDGSQGVLVNALRGLGDVWFPMAGQFVAFWLVATPLAWYLAFDMGLGTAGLMGGIYAGCVMATLIAAFRFRHMLRRPLRRS